MEEWNTQTFALILTIAEMERLQTILDRKAYQLTTEFENRLFLGQHKKRNKSSKMKK